MALFVFSESSQSETYECAGHDPTALILPSVKSGPNLEDDLFSHNNTSAPSFYSVNVNYQKNAMVMKASNSNPIKLTFNRRRQIYIESIGSRNQRHPRKRVGLLKKGYFWEDYPIGFLVIRSPSTKYPTQIDTFFSYCRKINGPQYSTRQEFRKNKMYGIYAGIVDLDIKNFPSSRTMIAPISPHSPNSFEAHNYLNHYPSYSDRLIHFLKNTKYTTKAAALIPLGIFLLRRHPLGIVIAAGVTSPSYAVNPENQAEQKIFNLWLQASPEEALKIWNANPDLAKKITRLIAELKKKEDSHLQRTPRFQHPLPQDHKHQSVPPRPRPKSMNINQ